jgi:hypothetical protein
LLEVIKPWKVLFASDDVRRKMNGYSRFRGSLKIQIMINGSAFHRGLAFASYLPLGDEQSNVGPIFNDGIFTTVGGVGIGQPNGAAYHSFNSAQGFYGSTIGYRRLVPLSQRQHIKLYPAVGQGGDMVLPLVFPHEYVPIDQWSTFDPLGGVEERAATIDNLGTLTLQSVGTLGFLGSNNPESVDITILASFDDDLELVAPTTYYLQAGDLVFQSGEPMSSNIRHARPSSLPSMSDWAGVVAKLGPAAARLMGFSNPPLLTSVDTVRVQNVPNMANTQLSARDEVLAADPASTLVATCDSLGGSDSDLLISNLAAKSSYLTAFVWPAVGPGSTTHSTLFRAYPSPAMSPTVVRLGGVSTVARYDQVLPIPMEWLSETYRLWRGDIVFGFEVITTKFQRGRLKVCFDPLGAMALDTDHTGKVYTKIFDISEGTEFEFVVPYMATTAWLSTQHSLDSIPDPASADARHNIVPSSLDAAGETMPPYNPATHNGLLTLQVLNTLTNDLDAYVMVTVRAGPSFELAVPCGLSEAISLQDQYFMQSSDWVLQSGDPVQDCYVGEKSSSIKDLCHRASPVGMFPLNTLNSTGASISGKSVVYEIPVTGVPRGVGYNGGDTQMAANSPLGPFYGLGSGAPVTFFHWFSSAFDSVRSSHRVQIHPLAMAGRGFDDNILVTVRRGIANMMTSNANLFDPAYTWLRNPLARVVYPLWSATTAGNAFVGVEQVMAVQDSASNIGKNGGSVHVPYQRNTKFTPTNSMYDFYRPVFNRSSGTLIGEPVYNTDFPNAGTYMCLLGKYFQPADTVQVFSAAAAVNGGTLLMTTSAGADMTVGRFCNAPTYFRSRRERTFTNASQLAMVPLVRDKFFDELVTTALS